MINWTLEQIRMTAAQLTASNPLLSSGQLAVESDTKKGKVGPGYWNALEYERSIDVVKADEAWETDQRDGGGDGGGEDELTADELAAVQGANSPTGANPFATVADTTPTTFLVVTAGTGSGVYRQDGTNFGKALWNLVGGGGTGMDTILWIDGSPDRFRLLSGGVEQYHSDDDVADPSLVTTWVADSGDLPLPLIDKYSGTLQEVLEAIANKREYPRTIQYSGTALTLTAAHFGLIIECTSASAVTITVPSGLTLTAGQSVWIVQGGDGRVDLAASSTTLNSATNSLSTYGQHATISVTRAVASNTFRVAGELS